MTGPRTEETLDDLQNGYYILQSENGFRFGMDAVLLADYTEIRPEERVLDLGCGSGILPLLLAARHPGAGKACGTGTGIGKACGAGTGSSEKAGSVSITGNASIVGGSDFVQMTGLELNHESVELARRSVAYNHLEDRISIEEGDIREAVSRFGPASFDVLVSNPPYMIASHGKVSPNEQIAMARHEVCCTFRDVAEAAAGLLRDHGRFYLVHRPFRLAEILDTLREYGLEPKRMRLVHPFADKEANMVLIEAVRGGNPRITVEPPLIVYESPGMYTAEVRRIYHNEKESTSK